MVYDFIKNSIENIYKNKNINNKKQYEERICELEIEEKFLIFIIDDIDNNCHFGKKSGDTVTYKTNQVLKELKLKETHILLETNCVETLKGLGVNSKKDCYSITIYLDN